MTHGSLFAGIGGFDLGFERAGIKPIWQVEIDDYCRKVLARHFPGAERFSDIRECGAHNLKRVDVISGGFPCQDISVAGKRIGIDGERSGLWKEYLRIVRELRPRYAVLENVPALLSMGLGRILAELAACRYDAEWDCIPACAVGSPHRRDRIWIVAYPIEPGLEGFKRPVLEKSNHGRFDSDLSGSGTYRLCNATSQGLPDWAGGQVEQPYPLTQFERPNGREIERDFRGVAHGVSRRVDRLRALGNAAVPQVAEWIGHRIMEAYESS